MFGEEVVWILAEIGFELLCYSGLYVVPLSLVEFRHEPPKNMYA